MYVIYVLWIKYLLMWFEILLVFILFKFKKRSKIWVVIRSYLNVEKGTLNGIQYKFKL